MAEDPEQALQSVMQTLTASALRANLARCEVLDTALSALEQGRRAGELLTAAERAAHQVVGSAGTFGFPRVSALAADLEHYLSRLAGPADPAPGGSDDLDELARAREWLDQMQAELRDESAVGHQDAG